MLIDPAEFEIPGDRQVTLSPDLEKRLKTHFYTDRTNRCQSQSKKGPNTRGKKGPLHLMVCSALARVLVI